MAGTRTRATRQDEGTKQRPVSQQPTPFLGLILAPLLALGLSWVLHYVIMGVTWGPVHFGGSQPALGLAVILVTLGAAGLGFQAWALAHDRHPPLRYALTGSTYIVAQWLAMLIWTGPHRWWNTFFVIFAWLVVGMWALPRLHVLRRDPRDSTGEQEDGLMQELNLKGFRFGKPNVQHDPVTGEPTRAEYDVKHRLGATRQTLTSALPNLESAVGAPEGLSRAVKPDDGKSNHTKLTLILKDPLVGRVPYDGPSHPGGSITDPALIGMYDDGEPVYVWIAGGTDKDGIKFPPTGYAFMGMTRAGKTVTENRLLIEAVITKRDAVLLYLNRSKGEQDVGPIIDGVEVAVLTDDNSAYTEALRQVRAIISYRQKELARFGVSAWSSDRCFYNTPTNAAGERMAPMPALVVHAGEADAILESAGELAVYLSSKGLSTGVLAGYSLQRWAATSMPTDLRFNIGARMCFGVGDDYSAGFALTDTTIAAGAHPENWRNTKPGRFFIEAAGIPDTRWPVAAKGIGDVDDDALYDNMRADCALYGPQMAKLDQGSAVATRGWWARHARETDALRDKILGRGEHAPKPAPTSTDTPTPTPITRPEAPTVTPHPAAATFDASPPSDAQDPDGMAAADDTEAEIASTTHVGDDSILGDLVRPDDDDPEFEELRAINPNAPLPPPPPDDVDLTEPKPEAPSAEAARDALDQALRDIAKDPKLRDPDDASGRTVLFRTGQAQAMYPFRSRGWYSTMLQDLAEGRRDVPPGLRLTKAPDRQGEGWYRLTTDPDDHSE